VCGAAAALHDAWFHFIPILLSAILWDIYGYIVGIATVLNYVLGEHESHATFPL
jgi:hypothetical protein